MLNSGPPELPRLIAASVWMKSSYGPWWMSRPRAETMPAVTDAAQAERIADRQHPVADPRGIGIAELPPPAAACPASPSAARCRRVSSRPITVAFSVVLSCSVTVISSAPSITWLLVTIRPDGSMMKPEPRLCIRRSGAGWSPPWPPWPPGWLRLRKSLKNCSNGEPGGNIGISGPAPGPPLCAVTVWWRTTFTTAGSSFAARSAKLSGARARHRPASAGRPRRERHGEQGGKRRAGRRGRWRSGARRMVRVPGGLAAYGPATASRQCNRAHGNAAGGDTAQV